MEVLIHENFKKVVNRYFWLKFLSQYIILSILLVMIISLILFYFNKPIVDIFVSIILFYFVFLLSPGPIVYVFKNFVIKNIVVKLIPTALLIIAFAVFTLLKLNEIKPVVLCGDLNVAHKEIDLKNPKQNRRNAGFTDEERNKMTKLLEAGFVDTFRYLYPEKENEYTWWSYMGKAREKNVGWRIDYFITSKDIENKIKEANIYQEVLGSDHCPIELNIEI